MKKGYIPKGERKKILLLADDIRTNSGVGTMSREIVLNTAHHFNWVNLGAALQHPEAGRAIDISADVNIHTGINDADVKIIPWNGYGDARILRQLIRIEKPDAVIHFTDPRYWEWLYRMEREIRQEIPIVFYTIWDDLPYPFYNKFYYESDDMLLCISKQTENIVKNVLRDSPKPDWAIKYVPHGIDHNKFFPVINDFEYEAFKEKILGEDGKDFVVFWNNRNLRRKNPGDVIASWGLFLNQLPEEKANKCTLLLHTAPSDPNGTDIPKVIKTLIPPKYQHTVQFTLGQCDEKHLNYYYNMSDAVYSLTDNEGWGLGLTEGMTAGKMIIAPVQGGMQDQMRFEDEEGNWINFTTDFPTNSIGKYKKCGKWAQPIFPSSLSLKGSPQTPYIYASQVSLDDAADALLSVYNLGKDEISRRGTLAREWVMSDESGFTAEKMGQSFIDNLEVLFEKWEPRERYSIGPIESVPETYNENAILTLK